MEEVKHAEERDVGQPTEECRGVKDVIVAAVLAHSNHDTCQYSSNVLDGVERDLTAVDASWLEGIGPE